MMSLFSRDQDPGFCGNCREEKMRAKYKQPRIALEEGTLSTSGSLGGKIKLLVDAAYPYEHDDESHCANINCTNGAKDIIENFRGVNKGLEHAARTGGWVKIDKESLERLKQHSGKANENTDVADIDWLDNNGVEGDWETIRDKIDEFEDNRNKAIERTAEVASDPDRREQGKDRIKECDDILDNLDEMRNGIYIQEIVSDHVNRLVARNSEQEVVVDEETAIRENEEDEQQEPNDTIQKLEEENEELENENKALKDRIEKLENENRNLKGRIQGLRDKIQGLKNDNLELKEDKLDLKENILGLKEKILDLKHGRESEAEKEDTPKRDRDRGEDAASGVTAGGGDDPPSPGAAPREGKETATGTENGANTASSRAKGGVGNRKTSTTGGTQHSEATGDGEQDSEWKQRWVGHSEPTRGPDFSNNSNGQSTEKTGPNRADDSDRDRTDDDSTPGGRV